MSHAPLVTVYIPCRNYGRFLAQAVESVLGQLYRHWELIIVDEASTDDTATVAQQLCQRDPQRISVLHHEQPMGLQRVANLMLGRARGKYMMRLDADDWLDEGALLLMVTKLESAPQLGLVYGNYYYVSEDGKVLGVERRSRLGVEDTAGHLPPHGACTMFRTRALKAAGGYSEDVNAQDGWELWYKLSKRVGTASLEAPLFYYRQHGSSLSRDAGRLLAARAKIFARIGAALEGSYQPSCLAVIGVRESYPGFEGVPYREIDGVSLLQRAIVSTAAARHVTQVMVSSQSQRVLDFAERLEREGRVPAHARVLRETDTVSATLPMRDILVHAGEAYRTRSGSHPDVAVFLSIHAINRRAEHIDQALHVLRITEGDSVVAVQEEREPLFSHGSDGLHLLNPGRFSDLAYDRERLYRYNGALIAAWWDILAAGNLLGEKIAYVEMSAEDSLQIKHASMLSRGAP